MFDREVKLWISSNELNEEGRGWSDRNGSGHALFPINTFSDIAQLAQWRGGGLARKCSIYNFFPHIFAINEGLLRRRSST